MATSEIDDIIDKFELFTKKPDNFLTVQRDLKDDIKNLVKSLYDYTKSEETKGKNSRSNALSELIVQDFDEEQIWQQIELQNSDCWDQFVWEVANCMSKKENLIFPVETSPHENFTVQDDPMTSDLEDKQLSEQNLSDDNDGSEEDFNATKKQNRKETNKNGKKIRSSIVDDKFFKLQDMETFLLNEERKEKKIVESDGDEESIDLFEDSNGDAESDIEENGKDVMYSDFFGGIDEEQNNDIDMEHDHEMNDEEKYKDTSASVQENSMQYVESDTEDNNKKNLKSEKKVKFAGVSSDDETSSSDEESTSTNMHKHNEYKDEKKSEFELRQQRLKDQITRLEEKTLKEAPWQLKGEVDASKRPQNSLLQEVVDFDLTTRPAPIITEQTTETLEDIIRRRIKDKAWDDVIRKEKPVDDQLSFRKNDILDHSKSKMSLAQVYEAEYLKQKHAASGEVEEEKEPESHKEIKDAMKNLFAKLDALCHYHYTPKAPQADVKIVANTPAISMEEVAPVATSDAALLAPEEIKKKARGDLISKDERSQTDKNRERRKKKKMQRKKGQVLKVTDSRNTKKGVEASDKSLKTSKAFFQQLNDDSSSLINKKNKNKG